MLAERRVKLKAGTTRRIKIKLSRRGAATLRALRRKSKVEVTVQGKLTGK